MHGHPCCGRLLGLVFDPSLDRGGEFLDPVAGLPIFNDLFSLRPL